MPAFLPGHWALSMQNLILLRFTDAPEYAEPTLPVRILTGGPRASPTQFRKVFLRTAGEGLKVNRPKAERSLPGMFPSRGPASVQPLRKQRGRDQIRRRGGPVWPPLRVKQNISGRAGEDPRPYGESRTVAVGSAEPGAEQGPQQRQFLQTQGPVARMEPQKAAQILRAGNFAPPRRYASPVMGVLGGGRHGGRSGFADPADCAHPIASFGSFSTWKRNPPRRAEPCPAAGAAKLPPVKNQSSPGSSKVNFPNFPPRNSSSRTLAIRSVSNSPPEMRMPRFPAASSRRRYP